MIAAARQGGQFEEPMILAIQMAYYLRARNPSDATTLIDLAGDLGLDTARFAADLQAKDTQVELLSQIEFARRLGARGFPSLILQHGRLCIPIRVDYLDATPLVAQMYEILGTDVK